MNKRKNSRKLPPVLFFSYYLLSIIAIASCLFVSCSFDYGTTETQDSDQPDIVMNDVEYVRVRNGDPLLRFTAESAERYEKKQLMDLKEFSFEQFQNHGEEINVEGSVGTARAETDTGNISMTDGISLDVKSEDIAIKTEHLKWEDKTRVIAAEPDDEVNISRSDGTSFSGVGFSADVRNRTWAFDAGISGVYFQKDDEE